MIKSNNKTELAQWVVEMATSYGASEVAVTISNSSSVDIEVRQNKVETIQESTQNGLSLQLYCNHKYSSHSTNNLTKSELQKFIQNAVDATKYLTADVYRRLPNPKYYPLDMNEDLKINDDSYAQVLPQQRVAIAKAIEEEALLQSDSILSVTSGYSDSRTEMVRVHSNGFVGEKCGTSFWAGAQVTVKDGDSRPEGSFWGGHRFFQQLPPLAHLAQGAVTSALRKVGQSKLPSGKYDMLVENKVVPRLVSMLFSAMSARALQQKSSFLDGKLNQLIASPLLTIVDNPLLPSGFGSRLFDGEGLKTQKRTMIENGVLKQYYIDNYYGAKLGMTPNGGSASNIEFQLGNSTQDEMIKMVQNGILVTAFNGGNANATTGDFSFGVSGFLIQNGVLIKPIHEMNTSGQALQLWERLVQVGNNPYPYASALSPSMLFEGVDFSGV